MNSSKRIALAVLLFVATWAWAEDASTPHPHKQLRYVMGTLIEIKTWPADTTPAAAARTDEAINAAFDEVKRLDAMLSNWRSDSELMQLNRTAGSLANATVSPELFARIQKALSIAEKTSGGFDPTVGPLVRAWGFLPASGVPGERQRVEEAKRRIGWEKVSLDSEISAVRFATREMEIDLGGIAKGYAAQRALDVLREHGLARGLVSLGGSSIAVLGIPPARSTASRGWTFRIREPRHPERSAAEVELAPGQALATSGTYEKVMADRAGRHSHIINPQTGEAIGGEVSVTVVADDAETADALTKPFFFVSTLQSPAAQQILQKFPKASVMLIARQGNSLRLETAGAEPARFTSTLSPKGTATRYVAKTR
jgi:thiamine biosynthesis lipoprotein